MHEEVFGSWCKHHSYMWPPYLIGHLHLSGLWWGTDTTRLCGAMNLDYNWDCVSYVVALFNQTPTSRWYMGMVYYRPDTMNTRITMKLGYEHKVSKYTTSGALSEKHKNSHWPLHLTSRPETWSDKRQILQLLIERDNAWSNATTKFVCGVGHVHSRPHTLCAWSLNTNLSFNNEHNREGLCDTQQQNVHFARTPVTYDWTFLLSMIM